MVSMGWQDVVVGLLLLLAVAVVLRRIIRFVQGASKKNNPCESCTSDCKLRDYRSECSCGCRGNQNNLKKNCPK